MNEKICKHEFEYQETIRKTRLVTLDYYLYFKIDFYFCKHCLEQREIKKEEKSTETPDWY